MEDPQADKGITKEVPKADSSRLTINQLDDRLSIPVRYIIPTVCSLLAIVVGGVWMLFTTIINPIQAQITELKMKGITINSQSATISNCVFLEGNDGKSYSENQDLQIKKLVYLLKQRQDLVLVIAGYTGLKYKKEESEQAESTEECARRIKTTFEKLGIDPKRIFYKGYADNVPSNFPRNRDLNAALLLVDLYSMMATSINDRNVSSAS